MKTKLSLSAALILCTSTLLIAQDNRSQGRPPAGRPQQGQQSRGDSFGGGQGGGMGRPPTLPIVEALDANKNHVIDADEIANASAALKKLDKNGDGKLTPDEFLPPRPSGSGGPGQSSQGGGQQRGPGGQGGPGGGPDSQGRPPQSRQ